MNTITWRVQDSRDVYTVFGLTAPVSLWCMMILALPSLFVVIIVWLAPNLKEFPVLRPAILVFVFGCLLAGGLEVFERAHLFFNAISISVAPKKVSLRTGFVRRTFLPTDMDRIALDDTSAGRVLLVIALRTAGITTGELKLNIPDRIICDELREIVKSLNSQVVQSQSIAGGAASE